jgi:signal transduction histidine kinase
VESEALPSRTLQQRIGGRWAISWQTFAITGVLGVFSLFAGEQYAFTNSETFLKWLLTSVIAVAALAVLFVLLNHTIFRHRRTNPLPVWVVVIADGLFGAIFSVVVSLCIDSLGLSTTTTMAQRVFLNSLYAMWWGPTLSYVFDYREEAATRRHSLIASAVNLEIAQIQRSEIVDRLYQEIVEEVGDELSPTKARLETLIAATGSTSSLALISPKEDWREVSQLLLGTAENSVRPLSKRLWKRNAERYSRTRWWNLPLNIIRYQPFRPLGYAAVDVVGTLPANVHLFGFSRGLFILFSGLALTVCIMLVANVLLSKYLKHHALIFLMTIVALQSTVILRTQLRELWVPGSSEVSWQVTQVIAGILVVFVTSGFGAMRSRDAMLQDNFRSEIQHEEVNAIALSQQVADLARETSQVLHGSVQTRLVACAMMIEQASEQNNQELLNLALAEALDALDSPLAPVKITGSIAEEIQRKVSLWDGLCEFEIRIEPDVETDSGTNAAVVGRIIEEAISNAIRHGKASHVDISVEHDQDGQLIITVVDDGIGPQSQQPGIGSAFLDQVSGGHWSLEAKNLETKLVVAVTQVRNN